MTMEKDSFEGLMSSLNLDDKFVTYKVHPQLNYQQLVIIKDNIETQLETLFDLLKNQFNADMNTSLLTGDGFPRDDIDVVSIRLIRVRIIRLRNDHKEVLALIESKLQQQFATNTTIDPSTIPRAKPKSYTVAFARIDEVITESPAESAGLKLNDKILLFDNDIHAGNHNKLTALVSRVQNKIDQDIPVVVQRSGSQVNLSLKPSNQWHGKGVLGCKIVPI